MFRARPHLSATLLAMIVAGAGPAFAQTPASPNEGIDFFEAKIRPVLVEHCYKCHAQESEKLKGSLHLDTRAGMLKGGESGRPAVVPGDVTRSLLLEAIRYENADLQMPPKQKLAPKIIEDFVAWIEMGAPDPRTNGAALSLPSGARSPGKHWAFQPPRRPELPAVTDADWPRAPIDYFVLAKLEAQRLRPSAPVDRRTLIRRATFDLWGLPPTAAEVEAFISDRAPDAYGRLLERLLASPRYGERWARYWLDVARYADTKGYVYSDREEGRFVHAHVYRDWVIDAFNADMPYDQFLMRQLAADQYPRAVLTLPGDRSVPSIAQVAQRDLAALGYLTLGRRFLGVAHDIIDDRIDVVTRGTMGLTVSCARCHDHKYDPIPTEDYYSLYGVFAGSYEQLVSLEPAGASTTEFERELKKRVSKLEEKYHEKRAKMEERLRRQAERYVVAVLDADQFPTELFYEIRGPDDLNPVIVRQWQAHIRTRVQEGDPIFAAWGQLAALPAAKFAEEAPGIVAAMSRSNSANATLLRALGEAKLASMKDVSGVYGKLLSQAEADWQKLTNSPALPDADREAIRQVLYGRDAPTRLPSGSIADLEWFFDETGRVELAKLQSEIDRWIIQARGATPHALVLADRLNPQNARVFKRGNPASKGAEVPRRFLSALTTGKPAPFAQGSGRLELARAIASSDNPLTARVLVNRVWHHHFGAGLVRTLSDFGTRSEMPTHPALLDWLACQFMDEGWSIKNLHRWLMRSSTYQQSSQAAFPQMAPLLASGRPSERSRPPAEIDPENRLLWRMNRRRLDFEAMRDALLFAAGDLDCRPGGRADDLFSRNGSQRRSVFAFIDRQFVPGILRVFDFANPDTHTPQRHDTTVPQQALFFLNSKFIAQRARSLAAQADKRGGSLNARIAYLYRTLYQRQPSPAELRTGLEFIHSVHRDEAGELPPPKATPWVYGFGTFDAVTEQVRSFARLPHFTGSAWQGGAEWPDASLGWVQLTAEGGHAGNDADHAAIRRWVAPTNGTVSIRGQVKHEKKAGDGVRAYLVSSRFGLRGQWHLHDRAVDAQADRLPVVAGDTIDFVVDYAADLNSDEFTWAPTLSFRTTESTAEDAIEWNARKDFSGPPEARQPLTPWEKYAQVLLVANEFLFVD